jgi:hypothetical protein
MSQYVQVFDCQQINGNNYCNPVGYIEASTLAEGSAFFPELTTEEVGILVSATLLFLSTCLIFKKLGKAIFK